MSIVIIGGHERMEREYISIAKALGYKTKVYTTMSSKVKSIGNAEAIILFTSTVSHKMSMKVVNEAKRKNIPILRSHSSSQCALKECFKKLDGCLGDCKSCNKITN